MPLPIGEPERHDRGAADVLQAPGEDRVVGGVGQDREALVDELLGGGHELDGVGQQRAVVADHLELHPVGVERLARELRGEHRVARREAAGGVRQRLHPALVEHVDQRALHRGLDPAQRDGDHLGGARADRVRQRLEPREAAGAEDQPRAELAAGDASARQPPCTAVTISTRAPSCDPRRRPCARAARPRRRPPRPCRGAPRRPARRAGRRPCRVSSRGSPVDRDHTAALRVKRCGEKACSSASPASSAATRPAVTGASRIPLRWWPVATTTRSSSRPISGALSGVPGRSPASELLDLALEDAGDELGGVAQELVDRERGHRGVEAALFDRRPEDQAPVAARHDVAASKRSVR